MLFFLSYNGADGVFNIALHHNVYASNPLLFGEMSRLIATGKRPPEQRTPSFEAVKTEQGVQQSRTNVEQLARLAEELTAKLSRFKLAG